MILLPVLTASCRASVETPVGGASAQAAGSTSSGSRKPASPRLKAAQEEYDLAQKRVAMWEGELKSARNREMRDARPSAHEYRLAVEQKLDEVKEDEEQAREALKVIQAQER